MFLTSGTTGVPQNNTVERGATIGTSSCSCGPPRPSPGSRGIRSWCLFPGESYRPTDRPAGTNRTATQNEAGTTRDDCSGAVFPDRRPRRPRTERKRTEQNRTVVERCFFRARCEEGAYNTLLIQPVNPLGARGLTDSNVSGLIVKVAKVNGIVYDSLRSHFEFLEYRSTNSSNYVLNISCTIYKTTKANKPTTNHRQNQRDYSHELE